MNGEYKVMTPDDIDDILAFEMERLPGEGIEKEMQAWHALWRRESLEHYAPLGWSFVMRAEGKLQGYVLAQPLLFFKGWTQTLWIEHIGTTTPELGTYLFEIIYRWARDKHFQKVYFHESLKFVNKDALPISPDGTINSITTTKM
ncbi:MAG: hypothetical protein IT287_05670 [Bdellovibrionaceae bacterium]|nr:hypothetical protein [Pseudobdellovibrionaceae bacterium]